LQAPGPISIPIGAAAAAVLVAAAAIFETAVAAELLTGSMMSAEKGICVGRTIVRRAAAAAPAIRI
jgi:hypothetical protein